MSKKLARGIGIVVTAGMLLTLALGAVAYAQEAASPAAATPAVTSEQASAAAGTEAEPKSEAAAEGAESENEIPHTVGNPTPAQLQDLQNAWAPMEGYSILVVSIIGLVIAVAIVGYGVYKQARV